jgi:hypothetical protein
MDGSIRMTEDFKFDKFFIRINTIELVGKGRKENLLDGKPQGVYYNFVHFVKV